jgi:hypothetical protein
MNWFVEYNGGKVPLENLEVFYGVIVVLAVYDCFTYSLHFCPMFKEVKVPSYFFNTNITLISISCSYTTFRIVGVNISILLCCGSEIPSKEDVVGSYFVDLPKFFTNWMAWIYCFKSVGCKIKM